MGAQIIDGKVIANTIKAKISENVNRYLEDGHRSPKLSVILVGDDPASKTYVRNKERSCQQCSIKSETHILPVNTSRAELENLIKQLNDDPTVDGILLQLPLPDTLAEYSNDMIALIDTQKDVDGFHPQNLGQLSLGIDALVSCTPLGIVKLLESTNLDLCGKHAVVIGRSNTVGKPLIQLLLKENCTVSIAHSKTQNLQELTKQADILVVAIGKAQFIGADMVKAGAIVIDVGINRLEDNRLVGDVDFSSVSKVASYITKVPGGVGPMTVAMLMSNTFECYKNRIKIN